jgi:hypothetical protein
MSNEASAAFTHGARETGRRHRGRIAVIFQSRIAKIQAERVAEQWNDGRVQRFFTDEHEARRWALGKDVGKA